MRAHRCVSLWDTPGCLLGKRASETPSSLLPPCLPVMGLKGGQVPGHMEGCQAGEKGSAVTLVVLS